MGPPQHYKLYNLNASQNYFKPPWFEIEAAFSKPYSPVNLLDKRRSEIPIMAKDNFLIANVCSIWNSLWKLFGTKHKLSC